MKKSCFLFVMLVVFCAMQGNAQRTTFVQAMGRAQHKQILIRWATNKARAWKLSNQYGFEVVRFTVVRDNVILERPERKALGLFKPAEEEAWRGPANANEYAAIVAQALYGESFDVGSADKEGILSSINKAQELEQRFALSLFAADLNFDAAKRAGWGITDTDVKENEKYLYRIKSKVPASVLAIDSAAVFIGLKDFKPLPEPGELAAEFSDKTAMISWDYNSLKEYYNAYYIERSSNATTFYRVTEKPVMRMTEPENKQSAGRIHYVDTLGMNQVKYYYRVRGVTAFGEVGPPSPVVSGMGMKLLTSTPHIERSVINEAGEVEVSWFFSKPSNAVISGFSLNQSQTIEGPYVAVVNQIPPAQRNLKYNKLFPTNYFTITAIGLNGSSKTSMPVLVQPLDSIPPQAPTGLRAIIDSAGIVKVSWLPNTEKDLYGYKIFRSHIKGNEPTPLTDTVYTGGTSFIDTVSMRITNRKVFYTITALDHRFNQSTFSDPVAAIKPDVIPPTSPLITKCELQNNAVLLRWSDSGDDDVAEHLVYRKNQNDEAWTEIKRFGSKTPGEYIDTDVSSGIVYAYTLTAKDSSALESKPAVPVSVRVIRKPGDISVNGFDVYIDRENRYVELFWRDTQENVEEYQLYKSENGSAATLWKVVPPKDKRIVDEKLTVNTEYNYGIRVVTREGQISKIKWLQVKY